MSSEEMTGKDYVKVEGLVPNARGINIMVKIVSKSEVRHVLIRERSHRIVDAWVGDETGSVTLTLWDAESELFEVGDVVDVRNGHTSLYKGSLRLNSGRNGGINKVDKKIEDVNTKNNLSQTTHIHIPWRHSESRPFRRRRKR